MPRPPRPDNSDVIRDLLAQLKKEVNAVFHGGRFARTFTDLDNALERVTTEIEVLKMADAEPGTDTRKPQFGMTKTEWSLFNLLRRNGERGLSKEAALASLYAGVPDSDWPEIKIIDVYIFKIRKKLFACSAPFWIETVYGGGVILREGNPSEEIINKPPHYNKWMRPLYKKTPEYLTHSGF